MWSVEEGLTFSDLLDEIIELFIYDAMLVVSSLALLVVCYSNFQMSLKFASLVLAYH